MSKSTKFAHLAYCPGIGDVTVRIGSAVFRAPRDVLCAISRVARDTFQKGAQILEFPNEGLWEADAMRDAIFGSQDMGDRTVISYYAVGVLLQISAVRDAALEYLRKNEAKLSVACLLKAEKAKLDVEPLAGVIVGRLAECLVEPLFWNASASIIEAIISHDDFDATCLESLVKYLATRYRSEPEQFGPVLGLAATYKMTPSILSILVNLPGFDLRQVTDSVIGMLQENESLKQVVAPRVFKFSEGADDTVSGCLNYLAGEKLLSISCSSVANGSNPYSVLAFGDREVYTSIFGPDDSITFELMGRRIRPIGYALKSGPQAANGGAPVHWQFLASMDGDGWVVVHEVIGERKLVASSRVMYFKIPGVWEAFRYFRIRQIEAGSIRNKQFTLAGFEIFGTVY